MLKGKDRLVEGHAWWDLDRWRWIGIGADRDKQANRPRKVNQSELRWKLCGAWTVEHESHDRKHEKRDEGMKMKTSDLV